MQFYKNCANQKNWWRLAPKIRRLAPGGTKLLPGGYGCAKSTKNNVFCESTHHAPLVWRLAANSVLPSGSCSSKNPATLPLRLRTSTSPTIPIYFSFDSILTTQRFRITIHPI